MKPIIIVGAGPVGLTLAISLTLQGRKVAIFDKALEQNKQSRAWSIHSLTMDLFTEIGVDKTVKSHGVEVGSITTYNKRKSTIKLAFSALDAQHNYILSIPQFGLEDILAKRLESLGVQINKGWEYTGSEGKKILFNAVKKEQQISIESSYLIGCDGSQSTVREKAGIGFSGQQFERGFIVVDADLTHPFNTEQGHTFLTSKSGYVMLYPLPEGKTRLIMNCHYDTAKAAKSQEELIRNELDKRGFADIAIHEIFWSSTTRHREMLADNYVHGQVILAGDAAHIHSPAGGQGVNLGVQDAIMLANILSLPETKHKAQLQHYHTNRRAAAQTVINSTNKITELYTNTQLGYRLKRKWLMPIMGRSNKKIAQTVYALSGHGLKPFMQIAAK